MSVNNNPVYATGTAVDYEKDPVDRFEGSGTWLLSTRVLKAYFRYVHLPGATLRTEI